MKHPFHSHMLSLFTIGAGCCGLALRIWLFSAADEKGLFPIAHPADYALYILAALTLGFLYLATRKWKPQPTNAHGITACAYTIGGLSLILTAVLTHSGLAIRLANLSTVATVIGGLSLLCMAALKALRKELPYQLPAVLTVALMVNTVAQCRTWGAEPQLQVYFFPLLASVFLILSAYYKTVLTARKENPKQLAFFSQGALFFCCLSLNTSQRLFYLGMLCWAAVQLYPCFYPKKEA